MLGDIADFNFEAKEEINISLGTSEGRKESSSDDSSISCKSTDSKKTNKRKKTDKTGSSLTQKVNKVDIKNINYLNPEIETSNLFSLLAQFPSVN